MYVKLTLLKDSKDYFTVVVPEDTNPLIGRQASTNDIIIHDPKVSRIHARLIVGPENVYIQDINSRTGTFINGVKVVEQSPIAHNAVLRIGDADLRVSIEDWTFEEDKDDTLSFVLCRNEQCRMKIKRGFKYCPYCGYRSGPDNQ